MTSLAASWRRRPVMTAESLSKLRPMVVVKLGEEEYSLVSSDIGVATPVSLLPLSRIHGVDAYVSGPHLAPVTACGVAFWV